MKMKLEQNGLQLKHTIAVTRSWVWVTTLSILSSLPQLPRSRHGRKNSSVLIRGIYLSMVTTTQLEHSKSLSNLIFATIRNMPIAFQKRKRLNGCNANLSSCCTNRLASTRSTSMRPLKSKRLAFSTFLSAVKTDWLCHSSCNSLIWRRRTWSCSVWIHGQQQTEKTSSRCKGWKTCRTNITIALGCR